MTVYLFPEIFGAYRVHKGDNNYNNTTEHTSLIPPRRGHGCLRTQEEEDSKKGKPGWEHLAEPLHVILMVELPDEEANEALSRGSDLVNALLVPPTTVDGMDEVKREQLRELAYMKDQQQSLQHQQPPPPPPQQLHWQQAGGRSRGKEFSPDGWHGGTYHDAVLLSLYYSLHIISNRVFTITANIEF